MDARVSSTGRRTARVFAIGGACAAVVAACLVLVTSSRGSGHPPRQTITTASIATIRTALVAQLRRDNLYFHWVVCVRNDNHFDGVAIVRCNVDFGDPHIQAYCAVLRGGRLLTNYQDPAIPCHQDGAGNTQTIIQYG